MTDVEWCQEINLYSLYTLNVFAVMVAMQLENQMIYLAIILKL